VSEALHSSPDCYSRTELCRAFGLSRSGLYDHALKAQGSRRLHDKVLSERIEPIFSQSRRTYGARRLQQVLRRQGIRCGRKRLGRPMRQLGLQPVQKRRSRPRTTQSVHREPIAPNRLNQLPLPPSAPNQVWCADLTYLPSQQEGWLYLAAELDPLFQTSGRLETLFFPGYSPGSGGFPKRA
jgi:putative transposase